MSISDPSREQPVLVLGASGQRGGEVVRELRTHGRAVRAAVRDPLGPAGRALADEQEVAAGVAVIDAAVAEGSSTSSTARRWPSPPHRRRSRTSTPRVENHLRSSPLSWTIVRPATFMELVVPRDAVERGVQFLSPSS